MGTCTWSLSKYQNKSLSAETFDIKKLHGLLAKILLGLPKVKTNVEVFLF